MTRGPSYMGQMATTWSSWVLKYPYYQQMITQTHPGGDRRVSENVEFWNFSGATILNISNIRAFGGLMDRATWA